MTEAGWQTATPPGDRCSNGSCYDYDFSPPLPFTVSRHHRRHPQGPVLQSTCWKHPLEFSSFYPASTTTSANVSTNVLSLRVRSCPCRSFLVLKHRNHNSHLTVSWLIFWVVSFFGFWFFGLVFFILFCSWRVVSVSGHMHCSSHSSAQQICMDAC